MYSAVAQNFERRSEERKNCRLPADLDDYDNTCCGLVRNISKAGAFVETSGITGSKVGQELLMTIPYKNNSNYLIIKAAVAWVKPYGIGVTFIKNNAAYGKAA